MKIIRVFGKHTDSGYNLSSIKVIKDDKAVTDESRNTVYNVLRMSQSVGYWLFGDGSRVCFGNGDKIKLR